MEKKMEGRPGKDYAAIATKLATIFSCYAELLKLLYRRPDDLTLEQRQLAERIKRYLEKYYAQFVETFYPNVGKGTLR
jgi:hypothetical protein